MIIVSNTSPIINLACINSLNILNELYGNIYIPSAVYEEITNNNQPGSNEVKTFNWIIHKKNSNKALAISLQNELDKGEAEAIALAHELNADILLIDERKGRNLADKLEIKYTGILGLLILGKEKKIINKVKPIVDNLIIKAGFWIQKDLYNKILEISKEK